MCVVAANVVLSRQMPQVVEFPPIGMDSRGALGALVRVCKEMPAKGESFRELRSRLRGAKLWDRERPATLLRFLGIGGAHPTPSPTVQAIGASTNDEELCTAVLDRMWHLNPLLFKATFDLLSQRPHHKDEIYKHLVSAAYVGVVPSRPGLETWLQILLLSGALRTLGVAVTIGPRADRFIAQCAQLDAEEYLAEDKPDPEPVIPSAGGSEDDASAAAGATAAAAAPSDEAASPALVPASGSPLPAPLRHLSAEGVPSPRGRARPVPVSQFAGGFTDEVLAETTSRIGGWWGEVGRDLPGYQPADFGLDAEAWVENADEVVYRVAVAAALAFRLDRDRPSVIASFTALDQAGVLADLYQGTVPENLPAQVDARALMLASLAARRCAEVPELASQLEGRASAAEAFASLDAALGRGLFRPELFWIMDMLGKLGVIRYDDLGAFTVTPHRIVRDSLFRLGFLDTPYVSDAASLATAAAAARKCVPHGPADEILALFTLACGCAYDCPHRKSCDYPCRERLE